MKPLYLGALLLLGAIWGASFLFIGLAVKAFGPVVMMFLRVAVAGAILAGLARFSGLAPKPATGLDWRENGPKYFVVGLLNCALPFTLIAFSELRLTVSLAAVLNSTTPLFTVLMAALWSGQPLATRTILGVLLGVIGVAVLVGAGPLNLTLDLGIAVLASLVAAFCYGSATVYAARHLTTLSPIQASTAQLSSAAVLLAVPAMLTLPASVPSVTAIGALLALILLSTAVAYLLYFSLLRRIGSTGTASVTFLVPVFGSLWGVLFLHEPFTPGMLLGMALILTSVGLVLRSAARKQA